jgi:heptosyltransferase-1
VRGLRSRPGDLAVREFQRILLVKPSSLGDIIHALPVLHCLRERYPAGKIDWLIGSAFASVLEGNADLSERILFDRKKFSRVGRSFRATREFGEFIRDLRRREYDLVIDLQGLFRSGFLTRATGAPVRIGFANAREGASFFYTHKIAASPTDTHAVDRNLRVGEMVGFVPEFVAFDFGLDGAVRDQVAAILREHGIHDCNSFIAIAPGARWETKAWPAANFVQAINSLATSAQIPVVLLGGEEDVALCEQIVGQCRSKVISLAGKTSIRQMIALLERASVVLCHDSAPMHVAAALGRPLVCLTGPTNPARTGPYRRMDDVLRVSLPCSPCYLRNLSQCGFEHRCMRDLRVEDVVTRVRALLPRVDAMASVAAV